MQKGGSSALVIVGRGRRASKLFSSSIVSRDRDICFQQLRTLWIDFCLRLVLGARFVEEDENCASGWATQFYLPAMTVVPVTLFSDNILAAVRNSLVSSVISWLKCCLSWDELHCDVTRSCDLLLCRDFYLLRLYRLLISCCSVCVVTP